MEWLSWVDQHAALSWRSRVISLDIKASLIHSCADIRVLVNGREVAYCHIKDTETTVDLAGKTVWANGDPCLIEVRLRNRFWGGPRVLILVDHETAFEGKLSALTQ